MSVIAAATRELMAAGVQGEALLAAIERMELAQAAAWATLTAAEPQDSRSPAARRQAAYRARVAERNAGVTEHNGTVTDHNAVTQDVSPTPPSENTPSSPPKGGSSSPTDRRNAEPTAKPEPEPAPPAEEPRRRSRRRPEVAIPDGFPDDEAKAALRARAEAAGVSVDVQREAQRFRDHALSHDRRLADWAAGFRNWGNGAIEKAPRLVSSRPGPAADPWPGRLLQLQRNGYWNADDWGPRPGSPGCRVPPVHLAKIGKAPPSSTGAAA